MATYNFAASRFYNAKSLFRTYSDNRGFPWKNMVGSLLLQVLTVAPVRMARPGWLFKTSKTTTAWWLASNFGSIPLAMKCQINGQDPRQGIFLLPTQSWIGLENWWPPTTLQLHSFAVHLLTPFRPSVLKCDK